MKYVKTLALSAAATGALMAFVGAGTASASVLCSTTVSICPEAQRWSNGTVIDFTLSTGTSFDLRETDPPNGNSATIKTCKSSTIKGEITNVAAATGKFTEWTLAMCSLPTNTVSLGGFEVKKIAGTSNGTVVADGATEWTTNTVFFGTCTYAMTSGESMGDVTEGSPAVFHINAVLHKTVGSNFVCPSTAILTATYTLTSPAGTTLSVS